MNKTEVYKHLERFSTDDERIAYLSRIQSTWFGAKSLRPEDGEELRRKRKSLEAMGIPQDDISGCISAFAYKMARESAVLTLPETKTAVEEVLSELHERNERRRLEIISYQLSHSVRRMWAVPNR